MITLVSMVSHLETKYETRKVMYRIVHVLLIKLDFQAKITNIHQIAVVYLLVVCGGRR